MPRGKPPVPNKKDRLGPAPSIKDIERAKVEFFNRGGQVQVVERKKIIKELNLYRSNKIDGNWY